MNLVQQLQKTAKQNYENQLREANDVLDSVKANLEIQDGKDASMLRYFGTRQVVADGVSKAKKAKSIIAGEFITEDDIKTVCLTYNLRFLKTSYYKKEIPIAALNDLRLFVEQNHINEYDLKQHLMIIAPSNHFQLGKRPKNDPVILYRDKDIYRVVSKWGNDFNESRMVSAFFKTYPNLIIFILSALVINAICTIGVVNYKWDGGTFFSNVLLLPVLVIIAHCEIGCLDDNWNEPYIN